MKYNDESRFTISSLSVNSDDTSSSCYRRQNIEKKIQYSAQLRQLQNSQM
ncbi:hypothetical protein NPIL_200141, partial [Nephila pilipes]